MRLYVETNFIVSVAKGQEPRINEFWDAVGRHLDLVIPDVCVMEAFSVFDRERKELRRFSSSLANRLSESRRDATSEHANMLAAALLQAQNASAELLNDIQARLVSLMERLHGSDGHQASHLLCVSQDTLARFLAEPATVMLNPTDQLILQIILDDAAQRPGPTMALMTRNADDFATPEAVAAMRQAGIEHFFPNAGAVLGWLQGHTEESAQKPEDTPL